MAEQINLFPGLLNIWAEEEKQEKINFKMPFTIENKLVVTREKMGEALGETGKGD